MKCLPFDLLMKRFSLLDQQMHWIFKLKGNKKKIFKQTGPVIRNTLSEWLKNLETITSFHKHCVKWMKDTFLKQMHMSR